MLVLHQKHQAGKTLNPYQGLKRETSQEYVAMFAGRKNPKSLSGIETELGANYYLKLPAGKTLNPYQGLKLILGQY